MDVSPLNLQPPVPCRRQDATNRRLGGQRDSLAREDSVIMATGLSSSPSP